MAEATYLRDDDRFELAAEASLSAGQVVQVPSGEAAFLDQKTAVSTGARTDQLRTRGKATLAAATGVVLLAGQEAYWDHSANNVTFEKVNDRDFFVGIVIADKPSAQTWVYVDLNKRQHYAIDLARDWFDTATVGTHAAGASGFSDPKPRGGGYKLLLSSTNEAQKLDLFSRDRFAVAANWIAEFVFTPVSVGAGTAPDFDIGVAVATDSDNFDDIAEFVSVHLDGNASDLFAQSDDGTTDVALVDTTVNVTAGSAVANRVHVLIDGRNPADVQIYVNGALVLDATTFTLAAATGPLGLIAHLEKSAAADTFEVDVETARCWLAEQ
jgi:hypothetical protein